ncbi:response regulator transcription factor [Streptomyces turgidiscabies]|uniref:Transcriptional regulator, LuxR family n=1 Tax=Streptomyces turgidiscabies (strain Car8) TaxID=698760 RepID=L7EWC1_STRT8|nr:MULTISPECIES: LuxR C-terminal-related transcriptional regulator [Streptomyces]ELP63342.1 transcriptional regulator, LuxR family [Streptomyces turgidiscabies Car8]MDX3499504.1 LuxR C-terminal-related transcriptional regulator [Streptomyces turgidiscabies]GAQ76548.1 transcriptional regulator NarP [Streptomyces turgidiscabies]
MTVKPAPVSDDDRQLKRAIESLRHTTDVDLTFGGVVTRGRHAQLTEFAGNSTRALMGLTLGFGMGLGGKAVALHRPIAVNDYANSKRISHHYDLMVAAEGIQAVVAAPVVVNRTVRAVMYGAVRQSVGLGDRTVDAVMDTARALEQNLAVRDEVVRRLGLLDEPVTAGEHPPEPASPRWEAIREAYAELRVLAQHVTDTDLRERVAALSDKLADAGAPASRRSSAPALSARELDVLSCVALGRTNTDVAAELGLRAETVKSYLRSAMRRLGCHSRLEAVMTARQLGLLP